MKKTLYVMLVVVMIITSCQSKTKTASKDADAIRNIEDQWLTANKAKDINKVMSIFASDAVVMEPNKPISVGIEAIRKSWEFWFSDTTFLHNTLTQTIDNIEVSAPGDLGYARGTIHYSLKTPNGPVEYVDKFIDIYKKIDGKWKCTVGIWTTYKPIEGQ
jgi:ketosteroid isomerase-like protein